jgi:acetylornithine deacetylase/succinyl-diaminopimelate desuccinylase-like protein
MDLYINENGIPRSYDDLEAVNKIVEARANKDHWEVIDLLLNLWAKKVPDEVDAVSINLDEYRESLDDKEFATTKGGQEMDRRFFLSFPKKLMLMIRTQYKNDELPFDKAFYQKFAKKYPFFMVSEKI